MNENHLDIIRKHLKFRFERIEKATLAQIDDPSEIAQKKVYKAISFFIFYILSNEETRFPYEELLAYDKFVKELPDYQAAQKKASELIQSLLNVGFKALDFNDATKRYNQDQWINFLPDKVRSSSPALKEVLENWNKHLSNEILDLQTVNEFIALWNAIPEKDEPLYDSLHFDKVKSLIKLRESFEFYQIYSADFNAAASARTLQTIYLAYQPFKSSEESLLGRLFISDLNAGKSIHGFNELFEDCENVYAYIDYKLDSGLSKNLLIKRFCSYVELYSPQIFPNPSALNENSFQAEFARFLFLNGYFPIREAMLGTGRLDVLSVRPQNAVLYELKQLGFGKYKSRASAKRKLYSAKIQAENYRGKLNSFPNIENVVHVILFSAFPITFRNDSTTIHKAGITFHFSKVVILNAAVTTETKVEEINLDTLFS